MVYIIAIVLIIAIAVGVCVYFKRKRNREQGRFLEQRDIPYGGGTNDPSTSTKDRPPPILVKLPKGSIGVTFYGTPATVKRVKPNSPIKDKVVEGMIVEGLYLNNGKELKDKSGIELCESLADSSHSEGRVLLLSDDGSLASPVVVRLPAGSAGITFQGTSPTRVKRVKPDSPIKSQVIEGMIVEGLYLEDGQELKAETVVELCEALASSRESKGRILVLSAGNAMP